MVRFIDNFSVGTRGAASAEYFVKKGYAVIFLFRKRSRMPFHRHFQENPSSNLLDDLVIENGRVMDFVRYSLRFSPSDYSIMSVKY